MRELSRLGANLTSLPDEVLRIQRLILDQVEKNTNERTITIDRITPHDLESDVMDSLRALGYSVGFHNTGIYEKEYTGLTIHW